MGARMRLTLMYAGVFLLLGTAVLVLLNALTRTSSRAALATPYGTIVTPAVQQQNQDFNHVLAASWVALALAAVASAVLGWFLAGRVLRPVRAIATTARSISAGNLHQRLALTGPNDEFKQLGDTLDDLFARLETSFAAQRRFVANASHELRTPLTLERTLLELALRDPQTSPEKFRATCEELLASCRDQEQLLESLLTLASSERELEQRETVDLSRVAERLLAGRNSLSVETHLGRAVASGDAALLERLVANLLDNAFEHNVAGGSVKVTTAAEDGAAVLSISDSGERIPEAEVSRLFEPFQRLETTRGAESGGHHGLGLSIVRVIAAAHGATVAARPRPEGGLEVTVRF